MKRERPTLLTSPNRPTPVNATQPSPQDQPAYRGAEVAHILALPYGTVTAWSFGQDYKQQDGSPKRFVAVIQPADKANKLLSFTNLCELHLLAVIRRRHRITMPQVRKSVDYLRQQLGVDRPLASSRFLTNGVALFVEHAGQLLNVSQSGQQALRADFEKALTRIQFGENGNPVTLFPYTRLHTDAEQPLSVLVDPLRAFGRPVVSGAFVRTEVIEQRFRAGDGIAAMAQDYGVSASEVEEALRFESRRAA